VNCSMTCRKESDYIKSRVWAASYDNYKSKFLNMELIGCTALRQQDFYSGLEMEQENHDF
jgi:hypothetical protein